MARAMSDKVERRCDERHLYFIACGCYCWLRSLRTARRRDGFVTLRLNPHPSREPKARRVRHPENQLHSFG